MNLKTVVTIGRGWFSNVISSRIEKPWSLLLFVTESADWAIKQVGRDITEQLNSQKLLKAKINTTHRGLRNQILHFGSRNLFLPETWKNVDTSNKIVFTWFHGTEEERSPTSLAMIKALPEASKKADTVHTSCNISKENLEKWGVPRDKIVVVPLGVDLKLFKPVSEEQKYTIREELGLPMDRIIIGSFQKDGEGWGKGLSPKWVKGPDIFVKTVNELSGEYDIFVLLVGPARGYVIKELDNSNIPYEHFFVKNYLEMPKYYSALDLYLVSSRAEGGPKAILESMATGVPIVTTKVGMAPDIIREGYNGLLAEVDDVRALASQSGKIIEGANFANRLKRDALNTIEDYSWEKIARQYYEKIYSRFVEL
jgi:glycosyltransferase involved in cell wall biosynthesis